MPLGGNIQIIGVLIWEGRRLCLVTEVGNPRSQTNLRREPEELQFACPKPVICFSAWSKVAFAREVALPGSSRQLCAGSRPDRTAGAPGAALSHAPPPVTYRCEKRWPGQGRGRGRGRRRAAAAPSPCSLRGIPRQTREKREPGGDLNNPQRFHDAWRCKILEESSLEKGKQRGTAWIPEKRFSFCVSSRLHPVI